MARSLCLRAACLLTPQPSEPCRGVCGFGCPWEAGRTYHFCTEPLPPPPILRSIAHTHKLIGFPRGVRGVDMNARWDRHSISGTGDASDSQCEVVPCTAGVERQSQAGPFLPLQHLCTSPPPAALPPRSWLGSSGLS